MHFELIHPNKTRSRSVQLDKATTTADTNPTSHPPTLVTRSSSLAHRENQRPVYRSMLTVESPPEIAPFTALDLHELHHGFMPLPDCQAPWFCIAAGFGSRRNLCMRFSEY